MTFTYSGDPSDSDLDELRFLIQDTDSTEPLLTDEELSYLLASYTDVYAAAVSAVATLIASAARVQEESKKVGDLSISVKAGARLAQWEALIKRLEAERFRRYPAAPIVNANSLLPTVERDPEDEGGDFVVGQMDNTT